MPQPSLNAPQTVLQGSIERITFHNEQNGFYVLKVKIKGQRSLATVIGYHTHLHVGEHINCQGNWINDNTHGIQFRAEQLLALTPTTLTGIERYLGSGLIRGIGPHFAKQFVQTFGTKILDVIEEEPEKLAYIQGIGQKRIEKIQKSWAEQKAIRNILVFLQSHNIGIARAVRIYRTYGDRSIRILTENPYRLALDIQGIGFKIADTLAQHLGIQPNSMQRAEAGLRHVLQEQTKGGHCAMPVSKLLARSIELLNIPESILQTALENELEQEHLFTECLGEQPEPLVYLASLYYAETGIANHLNRLITGLKQTPFPSLQTITHHLVHAHLSPSQQKAVIGVLSNKITILTGGPGVGKTTTIKAILDLLTPITIHVTLCAPTGRAAKSLSQATGRLAKTIHRLLEYDPSQHKFKHHPKNPIQTDWVIIDETSMIDVVLMFQLLRALPDTTCVLFVGDIDQLPSVGPGHVLSDIIQSERIPTYRLTEIFRQSADSCIILSAHQINQGKMPALSSNKNSDFHILPAETPEEIKTKLIRLVIKHIPQRLGLSSQEAVQVLTPLNGGSLGTKSLNVLLQQQLNPHATPKINHFGNTYAPGDKVIQLVNNYEKEVFNGDIGKVIQTDLEENNLIIDFSGRHVMYEFNELDEIALGYACSIHKSQGSEYPAVIILLAMSHYILLERNLIYTAVTRGKQLVVILGQIKALKIGIHTLQTKKRCTQLTDRLKPLAYTI